jgi:hypothetical protein
MTYGYRSMLVHLNDKQSAEAVLEPVVSLASRYQAHVIGMHVYPSVPAGRNGGPERCYGGCGEEVASVGRVLTERWHPSALMLTDRWSHRCASR